MKAKEGVEQCSQTSQTKSAAVVSGSVFQFRQNCPPKMVVYVLMPPLVRKGVVDPHCLCKAGGDW